MRAQETAQFDTLARDTAATVRATVRRWWLDGKDRPTLHIEAERTFVGARPIIVHFSVPLSKTKQPTSARPPQMEVGAPDESTPRRTRRTRPKARPATTKIRQTARKTRTVARKTRSAATKTRAVATKTRPAARKARPNRRATPPQQSRQVHKRTRTVTKKSRRTASRR